MSKGGARPMAATILRCDVKTSEMAVMESAMARLNERVQVVESIVARLDSERPMAVPAVTSVESSNAPAFVHRVKVKRKAKR